jgi:hypothetical protein
MRALTRASTHQYAPALVLVPVSDGAYEDARERAVEDGHGVGRDCHTLGRRAVGPLALSRRGGGGASRQQASGRLESQQWAYRAARRESGKSRRRAQLLISDGLFSF